MDRSHDRSLADVLAWLVLVGLLILAIPLFLAMPVTMDTVFYDICARHILRGGALERDFVILAPPGMPWALAAVRLLGGSSDVALRVADLLIVTVVVALLGRYLACLGLSRAACVWTAALLSLFYLTASDWVQVQPDTWMFLPTLVALTLRARRLTVFEAGAPVTAPGLSSTLEGLLWGLGCLFKPFVIVPGALAWLVSAALVRRRGPGWVYRAGTDALGLLVGGLLVGAVWQAWLLGCGTFEWFWHNLAEFRGEYFGAALSWRHRSLALFVKLMPWGLIHLVALPAALHNLARLVFTRVVPRAAACLLAAFYLGWVLQATYLQYQADYHLVPAAMLGVAVAVESLGRLLTLPRQWLVPAGMGLVALAVLGAQPNLAPARLALWGRCWSDLGSAELKDGLRIAHGPTWSELERVEVFLRERKVADGDVLAYSYTTTPVTRDLGIRPAGRFIYPSVFIGIFASKRADHLLEMQEGSQRYIVTDGIELGLTVPEAGEEKPGEPLALPPRALRERAQQWPYAAPVVFRAGRYFIHDAQAPR